MRAGIITFHRANNIGAVLQAYALLKYIGDSGYDCELIDYYPNNAIPGRFHRIRNTAHKIKFILKGEHGKTKLEKEKSFSQFRKKYFCVSKKHYYGDDEIWAEPPKYDIFISGSDQILNTTLTGCSKAYYLGFVNSGKKVSYASSFGREEISKDEKELIKNEISTFDKVSAREVSGQALISEYSRQQTMLVVDPVFLLDRSVWESVCNEKIKTPDKYIFVYSMENSDALEKTVKIVRRKCRLPVIVVRGGGQSGRIDGKEDFSCGPTEFLRYIRDAEYVITNSFHGTAFSMIFNKKLFCVAHSSRNTRLENLLAIVGLGGKQIDDGTDTKVLENCMINYNIISHLMPYIKESKEYLNESLATLNKNNSCIIE